MIQLTDRERKVIAHAMMTQNFAGTPEEFVAHYVSLAGEEKARERLDATVATWEKNHDEVAAAERVIELTDEESGVLDHVLIIETPQHWVARNVAAVGEEETRRRLDAKVARHKPDCERCKKEEGKDYRNAKQRHADDRKQAEIAARREVEQLAGRVKGEQEAMEQRILDRLRAAPADVRSTR